MLWSGWREFWFRLQSFWSLSSFSVVVGERNNSDLSKTEKLFIELESKKNEDFLKELFDFEKLLKFFSERKIPPAPPGYQAIPLRSGNGNGGKDFGQFDREPVRVGLANGNGNGNGSRNGNGMYKPAPIISETAT